MDIQYFKSAWGDIKNSPGWFGKLCLLALVNFIPVFGQIVTFAYLYGWAREIAWGVHEPMPRKLIANEDGKFWRRGWFVLVLTFVFAAVPQIVINLGDYWQGLGFVNTWFHGRTLDNPLLVGFGSVLSIVGWIALVLGSVLAWIGAMRISIYDRLSAGFQLGRLWKMLRHDTGGILRIFGMNLLVSLILGLLLAMVVSVLFAIVVAAGVAGLVNAGYSIETLQYMTNAQAARVLLQFVASAGLVGVFAVLISGFLTALVALFVDMLVVRAIGYWTLQFDVPNWDGQDDPMPFELEDRPQEDTWTHEPPQQPYQPQGYQRPQQPQQSGWTQQAQPPQQPASPVAPVVPVSVPVVSQSLGEEAQASAAEGDYASSAADTDDAFEPVDDDAPFKLEDVSADQPVEDAGVLPGFTYAGVDKPDFPAAPAPASDPISEAETGSAVSYDEPAIVGAEFIIAPEEIEELQANPIDSEESTPDEN